MNEELPKDANEEGSQSKDGEPSSLATTEDKAEAKLAQFIEELPPDEARHTIRELIFGIVERGSSPKVDPEIIKIAASSVDRDNENKFKYLTRKQELEAEENKRRHEFEVVRHSSLIKMLWPILLAVIVLVLGCISAGIYLAATGHETLGFSILSATVTAVFAYLGGLGTPYLFKGKSKD